MISAPTGLQQLGGCTYPKSRARLESCAGAPWHLKSGAFWDQAINCKLLCQHVRPKISMLRRYTAQVGLSLTCARDQSYLNTEVMVPVHPPPLSGNKLCQCKTLLLIIESRGCAQDVKGCFGPGQHGQDPWLGTRRHAEVRGKVSAVSSNPVPICRPTCARRE